MAEPQTLNPVAETDIDQGHPFLDRLAERVRTTRAARGMTRKALARHARVSERYLAQLEGGTGNISILLLQRIARAMGVPVAELVDDRPQRRLEAVLLDNLLEKLSAPEWTEARDLLLARFGGSASAATKRGRIALIGMRGAGKSAIGRLLAGRIGAPFIELDREIEAISGMRLAEIFELFGQETFRRHERMALEETLRKHERFVLATGGGLVAEPGTFSLLAASCFTVWVHTTPDEYMRRVAAQGDIRPMAGNERAMDDLLAILRSREPLYARADFSLDTTDRSADESASVVMSFLENAG